MNSTCQFPALLPDQGDTGDGLVVSEWEPGTCLEQVVMGIGGQSLQADVGGTLEVFIITGLAKDFLTLFKDKSHLNCLNMPTMVTILL